MSGEIVKEWYFWLASVATGAGMAFAYDLLRLFRRLIRHGRIAVDMEDILYWAVCFCVSFSLLYYGNNGVIRFAAVFGAAVGMALYAVTLGRAFMKAGSLVIDFIKKIFRKYWLTWKTFRHKMRVQRDEKKQEKKRQKSQKKKQKEAEKVVKKKKTVKTEKDTGVSPRQK